ncbi:MAG: hypothetical protein K2N09_01755 [Muribaculaceae bacterium]|nr:hypothetical protein [Muribaculaceae bacterium]
MSKLVFKIGEETLPTVLNNDEFQESPFSQQLENAKHRLLELLDKWQTRGTVSKDDEIESVLDFSEQPVDNNIIAFLGERGSGKTSCLYSMKEIFFENKDTKDFSDDTEFLHVIDPSFFDEHHNILEIFLGELYHEYEKMVEPWERMSNPDRQKIRKLHGWFSKVRQSVKFLSVKKLELPDEEEGLSALSEGVNLRLLVCELIKAYLKCRGKKYLVISIDDIDLNIREAYRMMEQIRKYLVVPNVVILMAAKLEQLKNSIVLNLADYYKTILDSVVDMHRIQSMADRYLDKFIPLERRISIPRLTDYSSAELEIIDKGEEEPSPDNTFESVEFAVLSLVYKKCGYLFYNYEETPSLIIPETMRELRSLVTMLFEMKDRDTPEQHEKNKDDFKRYFKDQWMQRMTNEQRQIAETILKEKNFTKINKTVVSLLHDYAKSLGLDGFANQESRDVKTNLRQIRLNEIVNPANYSENISIGDVMAMLGDLNNVAASSRIDYLIFFVTTCYSIWLYELYDRLTESLDKIVLKQSVRKSKFPTLKSSKDYKIPEYLQIVGNSFFTLSGESFLPAARNRGYSRELSQMNGALLIETIDELVKDYEKDREVIKDPKFILRLNLVEFFMLCASRKMESRDGFYSPFVESKWRAESSEFYFYTFDSNSKNILFDITAPFVNFGFTPLAYQRFSRKILDIAEVCPSSLYSRLYRDKRSDTNNSVHDLLSRTCIRNVEVLKDLNLWMIKNKDRFNDNQDNDIIILKKFLENVNSYSVRTYELNMGTDDYHTINFMPFKELTELLDTLVSESNVPEFEKERKEQEILFMRIYRQENVVAADTLYSLPELIRILRESKESDIPVKDSVISGILKKTRRIMSNLLVEYLAEFEVVEKVQFSYFLDVPLFAKYKVLVEENLNLQEKNIKEVLNELEHRCSLFKSDFDGISRDHSKIQTKINSVVKKIKEEEQSMRFLEQEMQKRTVELNDCKEAIQLINKRLSEVSEKMEDLKKNIDEGSGKLDRLQQDIQKKKSDFFNATKALVKSSLKGEIEVLQKEMIDIEEFRKVSENNLNILSKEFVNLSEQLQKRNEEEIRKTSQLERLRHNTEKISFQLKKDQSLMDEMVEDASMLKQRKADIKSSLDNIENRKEAQKREYDSFLRRKKVVVETLENTSR